MEKPLSFIAVPVLAISASSLLSCTLKEEKRPMNILYIMSDDHSYQTISAYNDQLIKTPNIDRIAQEGARFTNSFVANSISGPSRACMLTGKHSHANGFTDNSSTFDGSQQTYPKLLQKAGYETAIIGKWHLTSAPTGFDYSEILVGQGDYYNAPFIKNGERIKSEGYVTDVITDKAIDWMENKRDKDKPFCLLLHHKAPHRTWMPDLQDLELFSDREFKLPDNFYDTYEGRQAAAEQEMSIIKDMDLVYDLKLADKENEIHSGALEQAGRNMYNLMTPEQRVAWDKHYDRVIADFKEANLSGKSLAEWKYRQYMRDYLRVIHSVDRNIGRVLQYLENAGLLENTMIVYTSDQGFYMGEHGWFDKRFMYEESFRTPLLIRLPKSMKQKKEITQLVQNIDYAPTLLELAGVKVPADMQGESMLPLLEGKKTPWRKSLYYHFYESTDDHAVNKHYGVRNDRYKLIHFYDRIDAWELYDLKKDTHEMKNVINDPSYQKVLKGMKQELNKLQEKYQDTDFLK